MLIVASVTRASHSHFFSEVPHIEASTAHWVCSLTPSTASVVFTTASFSENHNLWRNCCFASGEVGISLIRSVIQTIVSSLNFPDSYALLKRAAKYDCSRESFSGKQILKICSEETFASKEFRLTEFIQKEVRIYKHSIYTEIIYFVN